MRQINAGAVYTPKFFAAQADVSARSASVVVPVVLSVLPARSVVDVGCGVGTWAAEFLANGVTDVLGIDGNYVDGSQLRIPSDRFLPRDLTKPFQLDRTFDLAVCLEVAEHLPESRAAGLVADLTLLAPSVLFSAAIPGQWGTKHINEQYLPYWASLFHERGYEGIDPIRPLILGDERVQWCYQQNTVMFVNRESPLVGKGFPKAQSIVHQELYERTRKHAYSLGMLAAAIPNTIVRSIRYRLGRRSGAQ